MIWFNSSYLWLLLLIPLVAAGVWWAGRRDRNRLHTYFSDDLLKRLRVGFWPAGRRIKTAFLLASFSLFILGLAGPKIGTEVREIEQRGVNLMVILDLSRSMNAEDIRPSRLEKAKFEIERLINHSQGDRIGLLVFTGEAFVQSPMTLDHSALRLFLDIAETHQMPGGTTNFRAAFEMAAERFDSIEEETGAANVILMVSDGEDHGPDYQSALRELIVNDVIIFTIGVGTTDGARIPVYHRDTGELLGYHRDRQGQEVVTRLEPETLREIARQGNGRYYEISSATDNIEPFLNHLEQMQQGEFAAREYTDYVNRYQILLAGGILFLIIGLCIPESRNK